MVARVNAFNRKRLLLRDLDLERLGVRAEDRLIDSVCASAVAITYDSKLFELISERVPVALGFGARF